MFIMSQEGCTQGDNAAMSMYACSTKHLINRLKDPNLYKNCKEAKQVWFADVSCAAGTIIYSQFLLGGTNVTKSERVDSSFSQSCSADAFLKLLKRWFERDGYEKEKLCSRNLKHKRLVDCIKKAFN